MPAYIDNIEQLDGAKLLGVILQGNHKMDSHIQYILSQCAQRMYLLKLLKHQGMPIEKLSVVAHSLIVSWILYAFLAWGGFLSAELSGKLDALLRRLRRFGYIRDNRRFIELLDKTDEDLFSIV